MCESIVSLHRLETGRKARCETVREFLHSATGSGSCGRCLREKKALSPYFMGAISY